MSEQLLSSRLWERIHTLAKRARRCEVAVPFVGIGSADRLQLRRGDLLVCRLDEPTVHAGLTNPKEILAYLRRGVEVHTVTNLHAKVFVLGRSAIVGSCNLSGYSERSLLEAAVETSSTELVRACRQFVEGLRGDEVGPEYARRLMRVYRPPKVRTKLGPRGAQRVRQGDLVAVALAFVDFDERDLAAERTANRLGRKRLVDVDRFTVECFKWPGRIPPAIRRGVRVLQIMTDDGKRSVYPPARVLEVRQYTSSRGGKRCMVSVETPKRLRPRGLSQALRQLGPRARMLRGLKRTRRVADPALAYSIGRLWSARKTHAE
jgi:hypothetical protein